MTRKLNDTFSIQANKELGENWSKLVRISTELREITDMRSKLRSSEILVKIPPA